MVDQLLLVGCGGFFGAVARYWVNLTFSKNKLFPLGTFIVNLTGSFIMGLLLGTEWLPFSTNLLICTGFLGAYTTFSTFNFELLLLKNNKRLFMFLFYLISSYLLCILFAGAGFLMGKD